MQLSDKRDMFRSLLVLTILIMVVTGAEFGNHGRHAFDELMEDREIDERKEANVHQKESREPYLSLYTRRLLENENYRKKAVGPLPMSCDEAKAVDGQHQGDMYKLFTGEVQMEESGFRLKEREVDCSGAKHKDTISELAAKEFLSASSFPRDCADILQNTRWSVSGVYEIFHPDWFATSPNGPILIPIFVWCDMDTAGGGWTVFQRRQDGSVDFFRNWLDYENGFGATQGEYWLGLRLMNMIMSHQEQGLFIRMRSRSLGHWSYAMYHHFTIADASDNYRLGIGCYIGNETHFNSPHVPDALTRHNGRQFTTFDNNNGPRCNQECGTTREGGYWYDCCTDSNLNGQFGLLSGVRAIIWAGNDHTVVKDFVTMAFKPLHFW